MAKAKQKIELDDYEKDYWSTKLIALKEAEAVFKHAQEALGKVRVEFEGFAMMIQDKYSLDEKTYIDENGNITDPPTPR